MDAPTLAAEAPLKDEPSKIVGILAAVAVPNFINYRNRALVADSVGTGEGSRVTGLSAAPEFGTPLRGFTSPLHRSGIEKNMEPTPDDDAGPRGLLGIPDIHEDPGI
jgi:hypothetical protein